ncbi:MAG: hypothetical protein HY846_01230 [Nitrosomonadales bacterium]|nr:hypothetical protein [Nitrosomonadales bacterium]
MLRRVKSKFGITAPRLAVRPHVPWYLRWAATLPFVLAAGWLVWWAYDSGLELAGFHRGQAEQELAQLRDQVTALKSENAKLISQAASNERQAQMEHAANMETAKQLKALNEEYVRVQEDLSFFQNLSLSDTREGGLAVYRLKLERDTLPGEYRYRMLLVRSGQLRAKEFQGSLQLLVNVQHNGEKKVLVFPEEDPLSKNGPVDAAYQIKFKYYQRIERSFQLPPEMQIESVQVRIFEEGAHEPKIKQDFSLS